MRFTLLLLSLFTALQSHALYIKGTVTDTKGNPLPYTNIYVKGTSNGTSANAQGEYQLEVKTGLFEVIYQHLGYTQKTETIVVALQDVTRDVTLEASEYIMPEVVVNAGEDPAIAVIKKAIERRKFFLNAVESYSCDAYVKGMQRITAAPEWAKKRLKGYGITLKKDGTTILYLSESKSKLFYKKPGKFHEVIYSSKVSGKSQGFTYNSAQDFYFNFYERNITIPVIAARPFVSPLSENAFSYYNFKMLGAYQEGGRLINKIQVIPKSKSGPCFSGTLSIVEDNWNIHSLELHLTTDNGIQYIDSLLVTQYFIPVKDDLWLPTQQRYDATGSFLGLKGDGYYLGIFKNYELNNSFGAPTDSTKALTAKEEKKQRKAQEKVEAKIFTSEIIKIENEANQRDSAYWDSIRPIPLTAMEMEDYEVKDSIQTIKESKAFKDSTDKKLNTPGFFSLLTGYTVQKQYKQIQVQFPALLTIFNFNTVEGANLTFKLRIQKTWKKDFKRIYFEPAFRYGFTNKEWNYYATFGWRISQKRDENLSISGGKSISQFNMEQPQPAWGNTWTSLIFRHNYMKIYEQYYATIAYSRELYNGIYGGLRIFYAQRYPLENTNHFSFFPKVKSQYTANGMDIPGVTYDNDNITRHNTLRIDVAFHFVFGQQYVTRPDFKIRTESKYPELYINYKRGIPVKGVSDLDYDMVEAKLEGFIDAKLAGKLFYRFGGGGFPTAKNIQYSDYKHFYGNFMTQGETDLLGFFGLKYYRHSTSKYWAEAHLEHNFGGLLFNKIPGWRKLKLQEILGFHFLYTPTRKQYFQLDIGIANILKVLRADFVAAFEADGHKYFGARIATPLYFGK
ncbi:MAG: DUF5686 and carboxypeptidase regulatory-like domain-containing protein [Chitinophagales bacterium]